MRRMEREEFEKILAERKEGERIELTDVEFCDYDLTNRDLTNIDFRVSMFTNVKLDGADFTNSSVRNAKLEDCSIRGAKFVNADLWGASFRRSDLSGCDISGADLYSAVLEDANLTGIISDENTKWFRMYCPETGPFIGYKKCVNDRIVQLLIPADAKRTSATRACCRCSKAKVLTIKSFDSSEDFDEAWSLVDENFVYRKGQWVEVKDFNEDRWYDSTTGIHFWMERDQAIAY